MPLINKNGSWYWGSQGPFDTKAKALAVSRAAYASGYKEAEGNEMDNNAAGMFVGTLLHSATVTHFMHLQTKSYAEHIALGDYYDGIVETVDTLAESIQGTKGIITGYPTTFDVPEVSPVQYLAELKEFVADFRDELPQDTEIQNEVDNIANLINSTLYKLTYLR